MYSPLSLRISQSDPNTLGTTYQTGQTWQDGYGSTGHYKCTDQYLVTKPGECCGAPQCNFQGTGGGISGSGTGMISSGGTMTGGGTITGGGTVSGSGTSSGTSGGTILYSGYTQ
ncbi:hypothetical protein DPMN_176725 [Dreissena polymorpha]|uniref:Uncharacterized protein n=1 Tax=Dreissena polymorpha TaxID=45954 RepID=A0A9D4IJH7_DREPO|nr:hypothetical protein DPMN_176725 [Dreissena polymorpha]